MRQLAGSFGDLVGDDLELFLVVRIFYPVVQAAALQRVVDFPSPVGGNYNDGWVDCLVSTQLWNRDLEVTQHLQQESLELLIGPVQLVDEQDRRLLPAFVDGLQKGAFDQEPLAEQVGGGALTVDLAGRFHKAYFQDLAGVIPFVDGVVDVQAFIALEVDQLSIQRGG